MGERERRAEISLAVFMFLVFCLFISAFDSSQPRDVENMSDPPAFYFCLYFFHFSFFSSFPLRFLSLSFPLYLFFFSFYSMLLYSIILSLHIYVYIYFSMLVSHDLSGIFVIAFHSSIPFHSLLYLYPLLR